MKRFLNRAKFDYVQFPMCAYGASYRKWTQVATTAPVLLSLSRCCTCSIPHERLQGKVKLNGVWHWKTSLASAYPPDLAWAIAQRLICSAPAGALRDGTPGVCYAHRWEQTLASATGCGRAPRRVVDSVPYGISSEWDNATEFMLVDDSRERRLHALGIVCSPQAGPWRSGSSESRSHTSHLQKVRKDHRRASGKDADRQTHSASHSAPDGRSSVRPRSPDALRGHRRFAGKIGSPHSALAQIPE